MSDREARQRRLASNEALFREVNARLVDLNETFQQIAHTSVFVCECANTRCAEQLEMTLAEYQLIRENPRRFFVFPAEEHVFPEAEMVVERFSSYFVIEKIGAGAEVAEQIAARE